MPSPKAPKRGKGKSSFGGKKVGAGQHAKKAAGNPDIMVKRATYSKAARYAVLANAQARQKLIEMGGENTISVIREFDRDMSDEELAHKTMIKASDVRVVLNRLHSQGLFTYTRVRDRDSGWYTYIWKLRDDRLKDFVGEFTVQRDEGSVIDISGDAYFCPACGPNQLVAFDQASEGQFKCSSCGADMEFFERKKR